jgi:hypothetical protein
VDVGCCHVEVSAQGRSLIQRSSTKCGVPECDCDASIMRRLWVTGGCCAMGKKYSLFINDPVSSAGCVGSSSMANWNLT